MGQVPDIKWNEYEWMNIQLLFRLCSVHQRSRGVQVLLSERWQTLFLHWWFDTERDWSERVLCEKEFNAANHHRREHWQRVSAVHCQWLKQCHREQICLAWRSRSSNWEMALDRWTQVRYERLTGQSGLYKNKCKKTYQFKTHCKDDAMISLHYTAKIFWVTLDGDGASISCPMHSYI